MICCLNILAYPFLLQGLAFTTNSNLAHRRWNRKSITTQIVIMNSVIILLKFKGQYQSNSVKYKKFLITYKVNYLILLPFCHTCQGLGIDQHGIFQGIDVYSWATFCDTSFKIFSRVAHGSANSDTWK